MGLLALSFAGVLVVVSLIIDRLVSGVSDTEMAKVGEISTYAELLTFILLGSSFIVIGGYLVQSKR